MTTAIVPSHSEQYRNASVQCISFSPLLQNILPRLAAKIDVAPISDITGIEGEDTFVRTIYAGNAVTKIKSKDSVKVITVRGTAFPPAAETGGSGTVEDGEGGRGGKVCECGG